MSSPTISIDLASQKDRSTTIQLKKKKKRTHGARLTDKPKKKASRPNNPSPPPSLSSQEADEMTMDSVDEIRHTMSDMMLDSPKTRHSLSQTQELRRSECSSTVSQSEPDTIELIAQEEDDDDDRSVNDRIGNLRNSAAFLQQHRRQRQSTTVGGLMDESQSGAASASHQVLFNGDELFTLDDDMVRRTIYQPIQNVATEQYTQEARIVCLNFTEEHFEPGATEWYHLKDWAFELLCSLFNALAYSTGKKVKNTLSAKVIRPVGGTSAIDPSSPMAAAAASAASVSATTTSTTSQQQKNRSRAAAVQAGEMEADNLSGSCGVAPTNNAEKTQAETENSNFLDGKNALRVFIETLVNESGKVSGFRFWIFDRGFSKSDHDLLSLGLRESLIESGNILELEKKQKLALIKAGGQKRSKKGDGGAGGPKEYTLSKEYSFARYDSFDSHFLGVVNRYFSDTYLFSGKDESTIPKDHFKDSRAFRDRDTLTPSPDSGNCSDYAKTTHPANFTTLFNKESAMFYHVSEAHIDKSQRSLESYFSNIDTTRANITEENLHLHYNPAQDPDAASSLAQNTPLPDVAKLIGAASDKSFTRFPHPRLTYHLENCFLSHEFITRMPLPHRIGTTLYKQSDRIMLKRRAGIPLGPNEELYLEQCRGGGSDGSDSQFNIDELNSVLENMNLGSSNTMTSGDEEEDYEEPHLSLSRSIYSKKYGGDRNQQQRARYGNRLQYMGIHESESELSAEILRSHPKHLDSITLTALNSATIPRHILEKFLKSKMNEIYARLRIVLSNIGYRQRIVIREYSTASASDESHQRKEKKKTHKRLEIREYPSTVMDRVTHGYPMDEQDAANLITVPYIASTLPGIVNNREKTRAIERKAQEYIRRRIALNGEDEEARQLQAEFELRDYDAKVASGYLGHFRETIELYRPFDNSLYSLKTRLPMRDMDDTFLGRDIFLRLDELNKLAYKNLDAMYYDHNTGRLPKSREEAYMKARRELRDALAVEVWHEFFTNPNVSLAVEGVRADLMRQRVSYLPGSYEASNTMETSGRKIVEGKLPQYDYNQELRPYAAFRVWVQSLMADQGGITYNYKILSILYFAKFHHCRWHPQCNSPKLNILLSGTGMAGKSHALQFIKQLLPTGVGDMVTHITDQAFNVDRNLNDMLLIYEEFQNKYLGYSGTGGGGNSQRQNGGGGGSGGGGVSAGSDKDTTNFFKARLTSGATTTMSWYENEETGLRDMKVSKAHCQGNIFGASNNDFTDADKNVMSRFILLSVPKSKNEIEGQRPQDRTKHQFGKDMNQDKEILVQHRLLHCVYMLMEMMIKSGVFGENVYGVNVDEGRILNDLVLDHIQKTTGILTNDVRKRDHILELERCMALSFAVWMGLTSSLYRHLFYDPHDTNKLIGLNPRVCVDAIMPHAVVVKDMVGDAITMLSSLWVHEYQDVILESFATKHCKLPELRQEDFMVRSKRPYDEIGGKKKPVNSEHFNQNYEIDYNYIVMRGRERALIHTALANSLGELIVAPADINKLFTDLSRSEIENCVGYELTVEPVMDDKGRQIGENRFLMRADDSKTKTRPVVEMFFDTSTGKQCIGILVHFLKQKLPHLLSDERIDNLAKNPFDSLVLTAAVNSYSSRPQPQRPEEEEYDGRDLDAIYEDAFSSATLTRENEPIGLFTNNNNNDDGEMEVDDSGLTGEKREYYEKVRDIGKIDENCGSIFSKGFREIMENSVLEKIGDDETDQQMKKLQESYMNPHTKKAPWNSYIIADQPKPVSISDFYPDLKTSMKAHEIDDKPVYFMDQLCMMDMKPRRDGKKIIISNHNIISPSTRASLSIYKSAVKRSLSQSNGSDGRSSLSSSGSSLASSSSTTTSTFDGAGEVLRKNRIAEYNKTETWELDQDIDWIFCQEHLRNIAHRDLQHKSEYALINYPPCTFMAIMEDREKEALQHGQEHAEPLLEYPFINNVVRLEKRRKKIDGKIAPHLVQHKPFSEFMLANFEEDTNLSLSSSAGGGGLRRHNKVIGKVKASPQGRTLKEECQERDRQLQNLL